MDDCSAAGEGATAVVVVDATDDGAAGTSMPARSQGFGGEGIVKFEDVAGDKKNKDKDNWIHFVRSTSTTTEIMKCTNLNKTKKPVAVANPAKKKTEVSPTQNKLNPILQVRHRY